MALKIRTGAEDMPDELKHIETGTYKMEENHFKKPSHLKLRRRIK
jgi:hypothetical protein